MRKHECYCEGNERDLCALRGRLLGGHTCPTLAPWERELYREPEPNVHLIVTLTTVRSVRFNNVRGIRHHKDTNILTFEDDNSVLYSVPNVLWWKTEAGDEKW